MDARLTLTGHQALTARLTSVRTAAVTFGKTRGAAGFTATYATYVEGGTRFFPGRFMLRAGFLAAVQAALPLLAAGLAGGPAGVRAAFARVLAVLEGVTLPRTPVRTGQLRSSFYTKVEER